MDVVRMRWHGGLTARASRLAPNLPSGHMWVHREDAAQMIIRLDFRAATCFSRRERGGLTLTQEDDGCRIFTSH